jgi:hypothetical protein
VVELNALELDAMEEEVVEDLIGFSFLGCYV